MSSPSDQQKVWHGFYQFITFCLTQQTPATAIRDERFKRMLKGIEESERSYTNQEALEQWESTKNPSNVLQDKKASTLRDFFNDLDSAERKSFGIVIEKLAERPAVGAVYLDDFLWSTALRRGVLGANDDRIGRFKRIVGGNFLFDQQDFQKEFQMMVEVWRTGDSM